jgi:7-carboxy-7-deazaguanine synthase
MAKTYLVNEIFFSLQGEGIRAGTANFFVRFSGCNLHCNRDEDGFDCDQEFTSGRRMTADDILDFCMKLNGDCRNVIFTGGEPALQVDKYLLDAFRVTSNFTTCIETNGTFDLSTLGDTLSWITCSPKTAEHTLKLKNAHELKYVRNYGQGIPKPKIEALYHLISPAFEPSGALDPKTLAWCIDLVKENPQWRLSVQQHKQWSVR